MIREQCLGVAVAITAGMGLCGVLVLSISFSPLEGRAQKPAISAQGLPQLLDITSSTGINFDHLSSPEQKYIVESMSGGVALIDYDRDGWPDIYFTNAQSVEMAIAGK